MHQIPRFMFSLWLLLQGGTVASLKPSILRGLVVDSNGKPVAHAKVLYTAEPQTAGIMAGVEGDNEGRFELPPQRPGRYRLSVYKQEDGYPFPSVGFAPPDLNQITLSDVPEGGSDIVIHLGPPLAVLRCILVDKATKARINAVVVYELQMPESKSMLIRSGTSDGEFTTPVPVAPFSVHLEAEGYDPWDSQALLLPRGSWKVLEVFLARSVRTKKH